MQAVSFGLVAIVALAGALVIALAILASPIFAAIIFVLAFGAFLAWRGAKRTEAARGGRSPGVPSTEEATADPAEDSGVTRASQATRPRATASGSGPSADPR